MQGLNDGEDAFNALHINYLYIIIHMQTLCCPIKLFSMFKKSAKPKRKKAVSFFPHSKKTNKHKLHCTVKTITNHCSFTFLNKSFLSLANIFNRRSDCGGERCTRFSFK